MNEPEEYLLRWRGREAGPFSVTEINRQLDEHEIGTGHEIFYQDSWITVEEFLAALRKAAAPRHFRRRCQPRSRRAAAVAGKTFPGARQSVSDPRARSSQSQAGHHRCD